MGVLFIERVEFLNFLDFALLILAVGWSSTGRTASTNSKKDSFASQSRSILRMMAKTKLSFGINEKRSRNAFKVPLSIEFVPFLPTSEKKDCRLYFGQEASSCLRISYLRAKRSSW